jgi:hypothetical protein
METVHEEKRHRLTIKIMQDPDGGFSPGESGDDALFLVGYHRDFSVDGPKVKYKGDEKGPGHLLVTKADCQALARGDKAADEWPEELAKKYFSFGLEAYIHSGVRLALSHCGNFPDRAWDVSQLGMVFVSRKEWPDEKKAREAALSLIREWNDYLSGNVYGYRIEDAGGTDIDSCWGYSGDYDAAGGILDEARGIVDRLTHKGTTDERGQYIMEFARG